MPLGSRPLCSAPLGSAGFKKSGFARFINPAILYSVYKTAIKVYNVIKDKYTILWKTIR